MTPEAVRDRLNACFERLAPTQQRLSPPLECQLSPLLEPQASEQPDKLREVLPAAFALAQAEEYL